ncbi:MAG: methyl-accepting chemotaxis protein [Leptolyngbyaceae bacterium]|nr:methyl-accepting chemotaxis protein [Leptolyngbyaceae bacterium]
MKLSTKIYMGYAVPALILAGLGGYALMSFRTLDAQVTTIYDDRVIPLQQLKIISDQYAVNVIDAVNKTDHGLLTPDAALGMIEAAEQRIEAEWQAYQNTLLTPAEQALVGEVKILLAQSDGEIAELKAALRSRDLTAIAAFNGALYANIDPLTAKIQDLIDLQLEVASQERAKATVLYQQTVQLFRVMLAIALLAASPLGYWLSRTIIATLKEAIATLSQTAVELATTTQQQQQTAAQQAIAVTETSTTMDELNTSAQQSAQQAKASSDSATRALSQADRGRQAVTGTLEKMEQLRQKVLAISTAAAQLQLHATQIGGITALVSDLAAQTNMLALNAGLEAVQSGENGASFSIIAIEIRKLSNQSKQSSNQINALIDEVQTAIQSVVSASGEGVITVQDSIAIAQETAEAFATIRQDIESMALRTQQIYLTAQEQATSIRQVVIAMSNLDLAAQDTSSSINQTKTTVLALNQAATQLGAAL